MGFDQACRRLEAALAGPARAEILDRLLEGAAPDEALARLRGAMRAHRFSASGGALELAPLVEAFDHRTQAEGFHVLKEWDHSAQRFIDEDIPVLMLDHFGRAHLGTLPLRAAAALLLDYYLLYVLALVLMRVWDEGDVAANLRRVSGLLGQLQGPHGSGQRFVDDAGGLLFVAVSHYEPDDLAYHRLLDRVWAIAPDARLEIARVAGPVFGCHLRWGLPALYQRDLALMREDNFSDYPWVLFSVAALIEEYTALDQASPTRRREVAAALLSALSPDPEAFLGAPPASLAMYGREHAHARALLRRHRDGLLADFAGHRPEADGYSPMSLVFNFPHNVLIAAVVLGLLGERVPNVSLSALLEPAGGGEGAAAARLEHARMLTAYSAKNPASQRGRPVLMIAYDPAAGAEAWRATMEALRAATDARGD